MNVSFEYSVVKGAPNGPVIFNLKGGAPLMPTAAGDSFSIDRGAVLTVAHVHHRFESQPNGNWVQHCFVVVN